jgi:hypothetical protein
LIRDIPYAARKDAESANSAPDSKPPAMTEISASVSSTMAGAVNSSVNDASSRAIFAFIANSFHRVATNYTPTA